MDAVGSLKEEVIHKNNDTSKQSFYIGRMWKSFIEGFLKATSDCVDKLKQTLSRHGSCCINGLVA